MREDVRTFKRNYYKEKSCEICGENDPVTFHNDHGENSESKKRRSTTGKTVTPGAIKNLDALKEEFKLTRILCARCHAKETTKEQQRILLTDKKNTDRRKRRARVRSIINSAKQARGGCIDCGYNDFTYFSVFHFDHRNPSAKLYNVSCMIDISRKNYHMITEEIEKCDLRCANCHQKRTTKQYGYIDYKEPTAKRRRVS